jgi:pimeloyl-ACP methyl ester carboxylesterase
MRGVTIRQPRRLNAQVAPIAAIARLACALVLAAACDLVLAANAEVGAIILHGKWGDPGRVVNTLASALEREGYLVSSPEMPWSKRRQYDRSVEDADAEIDAEIAKLKARGAKQIVLIGHSLGAGYALLYGSRADLDGLIAIAPGHRPEAPRIAKDYASDVSRARELVASGKPDERFSFIDFNTGNRRDRLAVSAKSFMSYFDPAGPMNMTRNAESVKPATPVLWLVPTREEPPLRDGGLALYKRLPANPNTKLGEPDADHMASPAASIAIVIEWMRGIGK